MHHLRKLALLTALALAAAALAAGSASATVNDETTGLPYSGAVSGTTTAAHTPTLTAGTITIACDTASVTGSINGNTDTGSLSFTWGAGDPTDCRVIAGGVATCTVNDVVNVPIAITPTVENKTGIPSGFTTDGDGTITNTANAGTTIVCLGVFDCDAAANTDPDPTSGAQVTSLTDSEGAVAHINDTVSVTGTLGCPGSGNWTAIYTMNATTTPATLEAV
jgi:hypothetical protein